MRAAFDKPKSLCWYVCPTYKQAKMIAWRMLKDTIPSVLLKTTNEVELSVELVNGSRIELKGADNENSLRGVGVNFAVLDENSDMKPNVWGEIIRPMLTDTKGRALFIGTPKGKNSFWELYLKGQKGEDGFKSWTFKTIDNPYIDPQEVEAAKAELNSRYFAQEYEASFEDYTGLIWPEFDSRVHVIAPIALPKWWDRIGAIDTAVSGITAVLKAAVSDDGTIYFYEEYREADKRPDEVAASVREEVKWLIDPAAHTQKVQRDGKLYSMADEYNLHGIYPLDAQNDVDYGITRVANLFKTGKIRIFSNLNWLQWELERYHWSERNEGVCGDIRTTPYKKDDHLCDCLRYICADRPIESQKSNGVEYAPGSAWDLVLKHNPLNVR